MQHRRKMAATPHCWRPTRFPLALLMACGLAESAAAQESADLAQKVANPISNLVSVPFQYNLDEGYGSLGGQRRVVNIQPVVPFRLSDNWTLVSRTIIPMIDQDAFAPGGESVSGLGDIVQSFFFVPSGTGRFTWGFGPALLIPTATDDALGADQWAAGPTAAVLRQTGPWTVGVLGNHLWSLSDSDRPRVNATFVQPFASYTTANATTYALNSEINYDWTGEAWSVPLNVSVSQLVTLGGQPVSLSAGARYWLDSPEGAADGWGLRFGISFLYPK